MRRTHGAALLAAGSLLLAAAPASAHSGQTPDLRFKSLRVSVQVTGARFLPGDTVRVVLHAGTVKRLRTVRASPAGEFTVAFGTLSWQDRCSGKIWLVAVGSNGRRATYRLPTLNCPTGQTTRLNS